ncbi:MAG: hypothetical protein V9G18_22185 [Albidovulum sp.]
MKLNQYSSVVLGCLLANWSAIAAELVSIKCSNGAKLKYEEKSSPCGGTTASGSTAYIIECSNRVKYEVADYPNANPPSWGVEPSAEADVSSDDPSSPYYNINFDNYNNLTLKQFSKRFCKDR